MSLSTLLKFNIRYYRRHAVLSLLCLLGISLGVGIVVAVELINNSALSSLGSFVDFLSGKATHSIVSEYSRIDEREFSRIWRHPSVAAASPVIETVATTLETTGDPVRFIGIDPFLDASVRGLGPDTRSETGLVKFLTDSPPGVYLSSQVMKRYGLSPGQLVTVSAAGIEKKLKILGPFSDSSAANLGENLAVMDIAAAQEVFGRVGYLDRIDIILEGDPDAFGRHLPPGLKLTDRGARKSTLKAMLYSFQLNLAAMSLLALFVGIFLIYNFSMFSVLSRREDLSLLLTLGADRRGLIGAFVVESSLFAAIGSLIGIVFGYMLGKFSVEMVSSTISDLYFFLNIQSVRLTGSAILIGISVGFLATLVGTGLPALEVAVTPPVMGMKRRTIEDRAQGLKGLLLSLAILCLAISLVAWWASRYSVFWGFASAFGMTLAFALSTPALLSPLAHHLGRVLKRTVGSLEGFLAARTIRASLSRTSIAVAALAVALSMTIGVDTMIHSFRQSVDNWLSGALLGDLYVSPGTTKWDHPLPVSFIEKLRQDPDVEAVERYSTHTVHVSGKPVGLRVVDGKVLQKYSRFHFLQRRNKPWQKLMEGGVFISESLSYKLGIGMNDRVELATPAGRKSFPVVAVLRDYSSDQGAMHMDREIYEEIWKDGRVQSVALFLKPGVSVEKTRQRIVEGFPGLNRTIASNQEMRKNILVIFDKTFAPTSTLKGVSLVVALLGVATALMAIFIERSREMTLLGYLGLTPKQLGIINVYQAVLMGLIACLISVPCGLILTHIIVYAINYRSFGWSVDISVGSVIFLKTFFLTVLACLASSVYPTYKLVRSSYERQLSEE